MKKSKIVGLFFLVLISFQSFSQENKEPLAKSNKGKIYAFWGWNRGWYTNSDIRFTGNNYDFTLTDVKAFDRQSDFGVDPYLNPARITIPQTNFRIGYYLNDKIDISVGVDHMKYVMRNNQTVKINGKINDGSVFDGIYNNEDINLGLDFLIYEHTDGLNYLNVEITRNDDLLQFLKLKVNPNKIQINTLIGFGIGALMPKSNVTLWDKPRNDEFHFAGYGFAAKIGLNVTFFNYFFIRSEFKGGFIDMPNVRTSADPTDKASQFFFFNQLNFSVGFTINPFN